MNQIKQLLFFTMILLFYTITRAESWELTLDQAIEHALKNNRNVHGAILEIDKADAAVSEAFGYALPSLDLSASFSHFLQKPKMAFPDFGAMLNNATYGVLFEEGVIPRDDSKFQPMGTTLQTFAQENNYQAQAQVTQILFNSAVFSGIGASGTYLNLAKEKLKSTVSQTALEVSKAYYGVLLARDLLQITKSRFENAKEHLSTLKSMRNQGLISEFEELQAEVQVENIRPIILQMETVLASATDGLKLLLNIPQTEEIILTDHLIYNDDPLPEENELIAEALESNLNIKTLKIKRELDDAFMSIDRGGYWPTLAAFGNYTYAGSGEGWDMQNYNSSIIGVSLSINLFQGGRTAYKVEQDRLIARQTDQQISTLADATEMSIKAKLSDLRRVKNMIHVMQRNIEVAERAYQIASSRYEQGLGSELELKDADISQSQARTNYTNAVHDFVVAQADLMHLVGRVPASYYSLVKQALEK